MTMQPTARQRVHALLYDKGYTPDEGMLFEIDAEELVKDAYRDGAQAERSRILALLKNPSDENVEAIAWTAVCEEHCHRIICDGPVNEEDTCKRAHDIARAFCSAFAEMIEKQDG